MNDTMPDIKDILITLIINSGAIAFVKLANIEQVLTILVLAAILLFNCLKIAQVLRNKKKLKENNGA